MPKIKLMKWKVRTGTVDRIADGESGSGGSVTVICKGLFKKETDLSVFLRMPMSLANGSVSLSGDEVVLFLSRVGRIMTLEISRFEW